MERWEAKVIALFVIMVVIFFFLVLPIKVAKPFYRRGKSGLKVLACLSCFAGGIFLGMYLLHMMPEIRYLITHYLLEPNGIGYPVPEFVQGFGFFVVLSLEKLAMDIWGKKKSKSDGVDGDVVLTVVKKTDDVGHNNLGSSISDVSINNEVVVVKHQHEVEIGGMGNGIDHDHHHHSHGVEHDEHEEAAKNIILMFALSVHLVFEGISLGLQRTVNDVFSMMIAVVCHEAVISFSFGLELVKHNTTRKIILAGLLYSMMEPIGIAIGTAIYETQGFSETIEIVNGFLQGFSAGTFIYVTFFEILGNEIKDHNEPWLKIFMTVLGFLAMAGLQFIPEGGEEEIIASNTTCIF